MKCIAIIPARYASTRFPGKPLVAINGKPMVQHVYERALSSGLFQKVIVATDDHRIQSAVTDFGGEVVMTDNTHQSGTDRCGEVIEGMKDSYDVVINIQGDEPFIQHEQLEELVSLFKSTPAQIGTLKKKLSNSEDVFDSNIVKVVARLDKRALYFSRNPIPFVRDFEQKDWLSKQNFYKHLGIYAYRTDVLKELVKLAPSELEKSESLEQLRWLENGYSIFISETKHESIGIDTPDDLKNI
ncbi:MAG: 3-deoxy-manno-octulosonate cytidylyltransferase [Flavobacteriales bacterium]|nr:3-deoxy-manno-octulosonate cytidylyltransferase [Flavobacteriales bacterium]|tara:strand:- start:266 stop:991 length:726 start_codon:yes stop_codon:yes gene_type:complete